MNKLNGLDIPRINGLSLFSGIGAIDYALSDYVRTVAYCEIDPFCHAVLLSRMASQDLDNAPIWTDIRNFEGRYLPRRLDIIFGGFPCQDISVAGHGKGLDGERSGLFFEIMRLVREIRPRFVFLENVPAIRTRGLDTVLQEFTKARYDCRWTMLRASDVGALHRRERWFLLAYAKHDGALAGEDRGSIGEKPIQGEQYEQAQNSGKAKRASSVSGNVADTGSDSLRKKQIERGRQGKAVIKHNGKQGNAVADTDCKRFEEQCNRKAMGEEIAGSPLCCDNDRQPSGQADPCAKSEPRERSTWGRSTGLYRPFESRKHWQEVVSTMGKCSDGLDCHVDRLRALGNSCVPQQAKKAFEILLGIHER